MIEIRPNILKNITNRDGHSRISNLSNPNPQRFESKKSSYFE